MSMPRRPLSLVLPSVFLLAVGCYSGPDVPQDSLTEPTAGPGGGPAGEDSLPTSDGSGESGESGDEGGTPAEFDPAPARLRLLLARQYRNAIRDLLGQAAADATNPPVDTALNGFEAIAAAQNALNDSAVDLYEKSARAAAAEAIEDQARIAGYLGCAPTGPDDAACLRQFVTNFGRMVWRRALTTEELDLYTTVAHDAALELGSFDRGVESAIATFLQSPYFLYQVEVGEDTDEPEERQLTSVEAATRLSFFLLDTTPTAEMLTLAENGGLATPDDVRAVAETMVEAPGARAALGNFYAEVLRLRSLEKLAKDPNVYPAFSPELGAAMRQETLALIDDIAFTVDGDFRDILSAPYTFVNGPLAALYGLVSDPSELGDGWQRFDLPVDTKRGGILGQGAFLAAYAHISSTSPTLRGKFVREILMCQGMPAPPPDVVTELPMGGEYKTMRERLAQHMQDPACSGCHQLMDPIGLALENFDGVGIFRLAENGVTLDTSEAIDGLGAFDGARELGTVLRDSPFVTTCLVRNLFRHATGHLEITSEKPALAELDAAFADAGYRMKDLLVELVASPAFLRVGTPTP
jgi:hypothetical protein